MQRRGLRELYELEFGQYDWATLRADVLAGFTVAAVALPLALAFGVASGATAAAGLITAIVAGLLVGALAGAPYQISGPTGAMSAVLIVLAQKYGLPGIWVACFFSGILLLSIGLLGWGRFIAFVPEPVIAGFTSGIALIIAIGQVDHLLGVQTPGAHSAAAKLVGYFRGGFQPDGRSLVLGCLVIGIMVLWPRRWGARFPASLLALVAATAVGTFLRWPVEVIGDIPRSIVLGDHFHFSDIPWTQLQDLVLPTLSITALGAIESLLCGAVGSKMTGVRMAANQELIAQGVGALAIPFAGGVPATAAIARTSVGIKSGGRTRMVSIVHALALLGSMFALAPVMSRVPLAALAGVLLVTAWRMNEWESIRFIFGRRFRTAMLKFLITLIATVSLDLTQAIFLGVFVAGAMFLNQIASIRIDLESVDPAKLHRQGIQTRTDCSDVRVAFITGPLFFGAVGNFTEAFARLDGIRCFILNLRGVPLVDTSGLQALARLHERLEAQEGRLLFAALHPPVEAMLERSGLLKALGPRSVFLTTDQAIVEADRLQARSRGD